MSVQPVIGIVGHGHVVPKFWGDLLVTAARTAYVERVREAGGRPVVLPGAAAGDLLDVVDALILTGGGDVDPRRYGGSVEEATDVDPGRDEAEIALVRLAQRRQIPVLGVCRGLQVLVVAFGGTLRDDLGMSHLLPEAGHPVAVDPDSQLHNLLGERRAVSSVHRHAVGDPGPGWRPTAWADDGVIEAAEWAGGRAWPVLGVQWHPELDDPTGPALFGWLVRVASERMAPVR